VAPHWAGEHPRPSGSNPPVLVCESAVPNRQWWERPTVMRFPKK
jgi:hypothetical protein